MTDFTPLMQRLAQSTHFMTPDELCANWFQQNLLITIPEYGKLAFHPQLLNAIRRALGRQLMRSASSEALNRTPCQWMPPCALDVFFREQLRHAGHGLPKPYVLEADRHKNDLILSIHVLGLATDWMPAIQEAFVAALLHGNPWKDLQHGIFLPKLKISTISQTTTEAHDLSKFDNSNRLSIDLVTTIDATGNDVMERPWSLINRLCRRIEGLARWLDTSLVVDWDLLEEQWRNLDYDLSDCWLVQYARWSGSSERIVTDEGLEGSLTLEGDLEPFIPFITMAMQFHAGRGAVNGFGRLRVIQK